MVGHYCKLLVELTNKFYGLKDCLNDYISPADHK